MAFKILCLCAKCNHRPSSYTSCSKTFFPLLQIKLPFGFNPSSAELSEEALSRKPPWLKQSIREFTVLGPSTPPTFERSGLVIAATSFVVAASAAFLPDSFFLTGILKHNLDFVHAIGAGGLGLSLFLDDIGDKSVFTFNSLPEDEKTALIQKLEQQKFNQDLH
ncbi:hypothetical protein C1H46_036494 [Malus baccata]|uniref:Uncharacterized protein n=1 Tax=Malus baccata TaxID=106549 RepID=A0A540KUR8_MALBA|nr:hypothetical protein C1H46_036494 [Malus baccata]